MIINRVQVANLQGKCSVRSTVFYLVSLVSLCHIIFLSSQDDVNKLQGISALYFSSDQCAHEKCQDHQSWKWNPKNFYVQPEKWQNIFLDETLSHLWLRGIRLFVRSASIWWTVHQNPHIVNTSEIGSSSCADGPGSSIQPWPTAAHCIHLLHKLSAPLAMVLWWLFCVFSFVFFVCLFIYRH